MHTNSEVVFIYRNSGKYCFKN